MKLYYYMKKIESLLLTANNPPYFWYRINHYLNKRVRVARAEAIAQKNALEYSQSGVNLFKVKTYDGSDQCVHPDIIFWNSKYWMVVTPYPYGMEEYENPCIYLGENLDSMEPYFDNPLDAQGDVKYGNHLSDPCLYSNKNHLYCFYRKTTKYNGVICNSIWFRYCDSNMKWSEPKCVISSHTEGLLSPAVYSDDDGSCYMLYVNRTKTGSDLIRVKLDGNMCYHSKVTVKCNGIPQGYYVWHIGISHKDFQTDSSKYNIEGLFLLRNMKDSSKFELYYAHNDKQDTEWFIKSKCIIPTAVQELMFIPYKSCFVPLSNKILFGYRDLKSRYCLCVCA